MSDKINRLFLQSLLADASYANLEFHMDNRGLTLSEALVKDGRFGNTSGDPNRNRELAELVEANFDYVKNSQVATDTGFSATLFKRKSSGSGGKYIEDASISDYVIATRGTEPAELGLDVLSADIGDIGLDGIALKQGTDLFNWYNLLSTSKSDDVLSVDFFEGRVLPASDAVNQYFSFFTGYDYFTIRNDGAKGMNKIPQGASIDITGHSLGGHLASIMARIDPGRVGETYVFNGHGFDSRNASRIPRVAPFASFQTEWFFESLEKAQLEVGQSTIGSVFPEGKIFNIDVENDIVHNVGYKYSRFGETAPDSLEIYSDGKSTFAAHLMGDIVETTEAYSVLAPLFANQNTDITYGNGVSDTALRDLLNTIVENSSNDKDLGVFVKSVADLVGVGESDKPASIGISLTRTPTIKSRNVIASAPKYS